MARMFVRSFVWLVALFCSFGAAAQTNTYSFYVGNVIGFGGCTVNTPAGQVTDVRWRIDVTATSGASPQIGTIRSSLCLLGSFAPPLPVLGSAGAIGLNNGTAGSDVLEIRVPVTLLAPGLLGQRVLAVTGQNAQGSDGLLTPAAAAKGQVLPPPVPVPVMGIAASLLLGALFFYIAWRVLRKRARVWLLSLLAVSGTAWAVVIVVDGQVGDWASVTPVTDPAGDASGGQSSVDLRALYTTNFLLFSYLRLDVKDLQNPPVANAGNATLLEDASTTITLTGSDPENAPLTFQIASSPTKGTLGPIVPVNATSATVLYTATANQNGADSFTFTVNDGQTTSPPATVTVTVTPVNDAPSFTASNPPTVNEGSGAQSVPAWASFSPGPANESAQTVLAYAVSNVTNPALFATPPAVAANGTLSYTLAANASGNSSFTVTVQDSGGTANGGVDTSPPQSFSLTVNAVNSAPSFAGGANQTVAEDSGAALVPGWATAINDGDPDLVQGLSFVITGNTNPALFSAGPAVNAANGALSFTPSANTSGSAQITLVLQDDGGTANGGTDTSAPYVFTITVTDVNDPPVATAPGAIGVHTHIAVGIADGAAGDLLTPGSATDPDGPAPLVIGGTVPSSSAAGGLLSIDTATGAYSYDPPAGFSGADSFAYQVCDSAPSPACSAPVTQNIVVAGPRIWFVDDSAPSGGSGTLASPLQTLGSANALATAASDTIFLHSGDYTGGIALANGVDLIGQAVDGTDFDAELAIFPHPASIARPPVDQAHPRVLGGAVTLGQNNTVRGVEVVSAASAALQGSSFGTLLVHDDVKLSGSGTAIDLTGGSFAAGSEFTSISSTGGAANIALTNVAGSVDLGSGNLQGASSASVRVAGGTVSATYHGNVQHSAAGLLLEVTGHSSGTVRFDTGTLSATSGNGMRFDNADGTVQLAGAVTLSGGDAGVDVVNGSSGTFDFSHAGSSVSEPSGEAFTVTNSAPTLSFAGSISKTNGGTGVRVQNNTGGSIAFTGAAKTFTSTGTTPIVLASNAATTRTAFENGGLAVTATAVAAIQGTSGGRFAVTGSGNRVDATSGAALSLDTTAIDASGVTFERLSSSAATEGIVLLNTGAAGSLSVTGTGTAASGGVVRDAVRRGANIRNAAGVSLAWMDFQDNGSANLDSAALCGDAASGTNTNCAAGIDLQDVAGASLSNVAVTGGAQIGLNGRNVSNLQVSTSRVQNAGNEIGEDGIQLVNLTGSSAITDTQVTGNFHRQIEVQNSQGTLSAFDISGSTIDRGGYISTAAQGLLVAGHGTASMNAALRSSNVRNNFGAGVFGQASNSASLTFAIGDPAVPANGNIFTDNSAAVQVVADGAATLSFTVGSNTATVSGTVTSGSTPFAFRKGLAASGLVTGEVRNNTIGTAGVPMSGNNCAGCNGITITNEGAGGGMNVTVSDNVVQHINQRGVEFIGQGNDSVGVHVRNNTIRDPNGVVGQAVFAQSSNDATDTGALCMDIRGNIIGGVWDTGAVPGGRNIRVRQSPAGGPSTFRLVDLVGTTAADAIAHLNGLNTNALASATATGSFQGGPGACF